MFYSCYEHKNNFKKYRLEIKNYTNIKYIYDKIMFVFGVVL